MSTLSVGLSCYHDSMLRGRIAYGLLAVLVVGCSEESTVVPLPEDTAICSFDVEMAAPHLRASSPGADNLFPLAVGNRWVYDFYFEQQIVIDGENPDPPLIQTAIIEREIVGNETLRNIEYFVEETRTTSDALPDVDLRWWRHRQDETGLFRLIDDNTRPPEFSPPPPSDALPAYLQTALREHNAKVEVARRALSGGLSNHEIVRLYYPLEVGSAWLRTPAGMVATVEAVEEVEIDLGTTQAWRIGLDPNWSHSTYEFNVWYSDCGLLQSTSEIVTRAMDPGTGQTATITTNDRAVLIDVNIENE